MLAPIRSGTRRDSVTESLRDAIVSGRLRPGEQINQVKTAVMLGVSRGIVREALSKLEEDGLVKHAPFQGTFVTDVTPGSIAELYGLRQVIEPYAARLAADRAGNEGIDNIRDALTSLKRAAEREDLQESLDSDLAFHRLIYERAGHGLLIQTWRSIEAGVRMCLALGHRAYDDPRRLVGSHPDILAALADHDAERAAHLARSHVEDAGAAIARSWAAAYATADFKIQLGRDVTPPDAAQSR